jgi:hypothetical protein
MKKPVDLSTVEVSPNILPCYPHPTQGETLPADLEGATIVRIGAIAEARAVSGGGLVIEYRRLSDTLLRRLVIAANDTAMWVAYSEPEKSESSRA